MNGSGPAIDWMYASTYENDLDESVPPDQPGMIRGNKAFNKTNQAKSVLTIKSYF